MKNCAAVLCIIENKILLLKQYRHTLRSWEYEIPAGSIEENEVPDIAARREVSEETGYSITHMTSLGWYHLSVGSTTEIVYLFSATLNEKVGQQLDKLEKINVFTVTYAEFENMIINNEFHQCMGVTAWERYKEMVLKPGGVRV